MNSGMDKICIIIRVYDRIEDLGNCIDIIRDTWKSFEYYIIVVANGKSNGLYVPVEYLHKINKLVDLENNAGHLKGNAQLLQQGGAYIPGDCKYTIILEADTWIYGDILIKKYVNRLNTEKAVWASAQWYSHLYSLATDFAIIRSAIFRSDPGIFEYSGYPECFAANYLIDKGLKFLYITDNMPVHLPSYIKHYPFSSKLRFHVFPKSKMVTHHVELLKGGMPKKKLLFNTVAGVGYFKGDELKPDNLLKLKIIFAVKLSYMFPIKGWVLRNRRLKIE